MTDTTRHNDQPITQPSEDLYGFDPFAKAIADGIRKMPAPNGYVLAINGRWGAGKSSVINLVLHHLEDATAGGSIKVLSFMPWWFRGEEALALAFFRELQAALNPSLRKKARKLLPKIGARLLGGGELVGSIINLVAPGGGAVASNAMAYLESLIKMDGSLEALHDDLRAALAKLPHRFLIVIDDIDRLTPDEALLIFKLVKSVGQLPNVVYLLAYDRELAEKTVAERYPSEDAHFLEKIVQAIFEIPEPAEQTLRASVQAQIARVCEIQTENAPIEFLNLVYDVVMTRINKPRDLIRFVNTISLSWPAVAGEVHSGDFLALEALRIFNPEIYRLLQSNKEILCGIAFPPPQFRTHEDRSAYCDTILLSDVPDVDREHARKMLVRIFPPLNSLWRGINHSSNAAALWRRDRRACSKEYFHIYFRLALSNASISAEEFEEFIRNAGNPSFVTHYIGEALHIHHPDGTTKVATILDEITLHSDRIKLEEVPAFLEALILIADELNAESDYSGWFGYGGNRERIQLLCRRLLVGPLELDERSSILLRAFDRAGLSILVHFAEKAWSQHQDPAATPEILLDQGLLKLDDAERLRDRAIVALREAAESRELLDNRELHSLLFRWRDLLVDSPWEARDWSSGQLDDDNAVVKLAKALITYGIHHSSGDAVSSRSKSVQLSSLDDIIDRDRLYARCEELERGSSLSADDAKAIAEFLDAWRQTETIS